MQPNTNHLPLPSFPAIVKIDATRTPTTHRPVNQRPTKPDTDLASDLEQLRISLLKRRDDQLRGLCEDILTAGCGEALSNKARRLLSTIKKTA